MRTPFFWQFRSYIAKNHLLNAAPMRSHTHAPSRARTRMHTSLHPAPVRDTHTPTARPHKYLTARY